MLYKCFCFSSSFTYRQFFGPKSVTTLCFIFSTRSIILPIRSRSAFSSSSLRCTTPMMASRSAGSNEVAVVFPVLHPVLSLSESFEQFFNREPEIQSKTSVCKNKLERISIVFGMFNLFIFHWMSVCIRLLLLCVHIKAFIYSLII